MAVSARMSLFADNGYGEQEKDANSQLVELDKGLRSLRVGEQCESIVRFPRLFEKYPFPILINSALLKLADVFRTGSNFLRLCVLKVMQQSDKHLDKIINIDEFVKRIFTVIHSNDPVARAITLRTLGSCASVISERKNVHHSIINGLDSHDSVELEAAIFAADKFAAQSKTFASSIWNKLAEMMEGLETPVNTKLHLLPIFQHMHHDPKNTAKVRELCVHLLPSYPARGFVLVTLHMLSQLSAKSLVDIPQQVSLLLEYIQSDPRRAVKIAALHDLHFLASKGPHMWTADNIQMLSKFVRETPFDTFKLGGLAGLTTLAATIAVGSFPTNEGSPVIEMCSICCYHSNIQIATKATELLTYLAIHKDRGSTPEEHELSEDAAMALEGLLVVTTTHPSHRNLLALKLVLQCVVRLCVAFPSMADRFLDMATTALNARSDASAVLLCECLAAISSHSNDLLPSLTDDLVSALNHAVETSDKSRDRLVVAVATLLLQACVGEDIPHSVESAVKDALEGVNAWTAYRIARQAARYGHHQMAAYIFNRLTMKVATEHFYFWLSALEDCSLAESCLQQPADNTSAFIVNITSAEAHYHKAIAALKAATTPGAPLTFPCQYIQLRTKMLQAQAQLVRVCCSFQTSPPPAIATSLAMTTGQEIHRCRHVVAQLQCSGRQFDQLCQSYGALYQASFDADPATLVNLEILQQSCQIMMHVLRTLLLFTRGSGKEGDCTVAPPDIGALIEHQPWLATCRQILKTLNEVSQPSTTDPPATPHQVRPPTSVHMECIQSAAVMVTSVPLCLPRYFFQSLQATSIKLAISPQPRSANDPITIHYDAHLTLKIEGVIQHGNHPGLFRKVSAVALSVSSTQQSRAQMVADVKLRDNPPNDMKQTAEPRNDYFSCQFLLAFPVAGFHLVAIEAAVVDENGVEWKTGPRASLSVKSYDEGVQRQQQQQYAAQRQQQRAAHASTSTF